MSREVLTLCLDGGGVYWHVGVTGQVFRAQEVLAHAPSCPGQVGRLQVKRLPRFDSKFGTSAVSHWQAVRTLGSVQNKDSMLTYRNC